MAAMEFAGSILSLAKMQYMVLRLDNQWHQRTFQSMQPVLLCSLYRILRVVFRPSRILCLYHGCGRQHRACSSCLRMQPGCFQHKLTHYRSKIWTATVSVYHWISGASGVTMAPWWTADVAPCNVSARQGLIEVCRNLCNWWQRTGHSVSPVLCDVDLDFRIHKLHYSVTYTAVDTKNFMQHTPLLFGLWRAHKYC